MIVLVAPNAYKGTLGQLDAAQVIAEAIAAESPDSRCVLHPIADGGDGFVESLAFLKRVEPHRMTVPAPLGGTVTVPILRQGNRATLDISSCVGFRTVNRFDPGIATSAGLGEAISAVLSSGASELIIGVGGSVTVDLGLGMASRLGVRFYDAQGHAFEPRGINDLTRITSINAEACIRRFDGIRLTCACDVVCPLNGDDGGLAVFSPQKGVGPGMMQELREQAQRLAELFSASTGVNAADMPGAGAAGGISAALAWFCGAQLLEGFRWFAQETDLEPRVGGADLVISGEGTFDATSLKGKATEGLLGMSRRLGKRVLMFVGSAQSSLPGVAFVELCYNEGECMNDEQTVRAVLARAVRTAFGSGLVDLS